MDLHSGHPFWLIKNGLPYNYPKLDKNITTQVVIMGGGITGAIQAYYLAKAGIDFVVVEKRSIGLGSTCASTSLLQYQIDEPLSSLIEKVGEEHAVKAYQLCVNAVASIGKISKEIKHDYFKKLPTLFFASYKKDDALIKKEFQLHSQAGFEVELWGEKEIRKNFGFAASSALYSYHSAQIDAYDFCHNIFQYITKKGYKIYDRTEVSDMQHHKNGVKLQSANGYKIHADWLIYATQVMKLPNL